MQTGVIRQGVSYRPGTDRVSFGPKSASMDLKPEREYADDFSKVQLVTWNADVLRPFPPALVPFLGNFPVKAVKEISGSFRLAKHPQMVTIELAPGLITSFPGCMFKPVC